MVFFLLHLSRRFSSLNIAAFGIDVIQQRSFPPHTYMIRAVAVRQTQVCIFPSSFLLLQMSFSPYMVSPILQNLTHLSYFWTSGPCVRSHWYRELFSYPCNWNLEFQLLVPVALCCSLSVSELRWSVASRMLLFRMLELSSCKAELNKTGLLKISPMCDNELNMDWSWTNQGSWVLLTN